MYILIIFFFLKSLRPDAGTEIEALSPAGDTVVEVRVHDSWLMALTPFCFDDTYTELVLYVSSCCFMPCRFAHEDVHVH